MTLVDTNVLIDLLKADPGWLPWSGPAFQHARAAGPMAINVVIYAELSAHPYFPAKLDNFLSDLGLSMQHLTKEAGRAAAIAFMQYRQRNGNKTGVLPDFFIGAQAATENWTLLTRDSNRYRTYFPRLQLLAPWPS